MEINVTGSKIIHVIMEALTIEEIKAILMQKQINIDIGYKLTEEEELKRYYKTLLLKRFFLYQENYNLDAVKPN